MKGTEKQIKFAEDLMETMNSHFSNLIEDCKKQRPEMATEWENIRDTYNSRMNDSYAGCIIDLLANNKEKNYQSYYMSLYMSVKHGTDELCKAIRADLPKIYK